MQETQISKSHVLGQRELTAEVGAAATFHTHAEMDEEFSDDDVNNL